MSIGRPLLIALIALAVALLPMAGGMALAMPHDASLTGHADCCPHGKPCEKKTDDCGSMAGCALKCFSFSGAMVSDAVVKPSPTADIAPVLDSLSFQSNRTAPLLPPPRA